MPASSFRVVAASSTSSGKSTLASISASMSVSSIAASFTNAPMEPSSCRAAARAADALPAEIIAMTASAWLKSMRPFKNARSVNSPGSAARTRCLRTSESAFSAA